MNSRNTQELIDDVRRFPIGTEIQIATSQYADTTTPAGFYFDVYSTAQAVRGLIKRGMLEGESLWRFYRCTVISHDTGDRKP